MRLFSFVVVEYQANKVFFQTQKTGRETGEMPETVYENKTGPRPRVFQLFTEFREVISATKFTTWIRYMHLICLDSIYIITELNSVQRITV